MDGAFGPDDIAGRNRFDGILPPRFQTKALAASGRSTVRDWVDLSILMTQYGFTMDDFAAAYEATGTKSQLDIAFNRLTSGQPRAGDPGVSGLMENPLAVEGLAGISERPSATGSWKRLSTPFALTVSSIHERPLLDRLGKKHGWMGLPQSRPSRAY